MTTTPPGGDPSRQHEPFDWRSLHFPPGKPFATPGVTIAPNGPFGQARMASNRDLEALFARAQEKSDEHLNLLNAYAIAHEPNPIVVEAQGLPIPLGLVSPNAIFFGRSGSGKTQKGTLPAAIAAIRTHWCLIYLNVKGRSQTRLLRKVAAKSLRDQDINLLAPGSMDRTLGCTMLEGCHELLAAREVAACMVAGAARASRSGEGAWAYNQAEDFLTHAIAAICTDLPPERRTLAEIRKVVIGGDYEAFAAEHPNFPLLRRFANFQNWNRNGETVASTIGEATSFIDGLEPVLSADEFSISRFVRMPGILILEIDEPDLDKFTPFITLVLGRLIRALQREACRSATGGLNIKTLFVIDELAPMSFIPGLSKVLHTCREHRFSFVAATQSVSQLQALHGQAGADVLLSGFQSQIAIGGKLDPVTAEYLSRRCGTCTVSVPTLVETKIIDNAPAVSARSWTMVPRPLLLPGDIASPTPHPLLGEALTFILGDATPPFQAYVTPLHEEGWIANLIDQVRSMPSDDDLRATPLRPPGSVATPTPHSPPADNRAAAILEKLARSTPKDADWDWLLAFVKEPTHEPQALVHMLEQLETGALSVQQLHDARRLSGITCPRAIVAYAHFRRYRRSHLAKRNASPAPTSRRCAGCGYDSALHASNCDICGSTLGDPPPRASRPAETADQPPPRINIVVKLDDAMRAPFPETLPFTQEATPTRPKRPGRKRK